MPVLTPPDTRIGALAYRRGQWRRWDDWCWEKASYSAFPDRLRDPRPLHDHPELTEQQLSRVLDAALDAELMTGAHLVRRTSQMAILGRPRKVSHLSHGLLTLVTGGVWGFVWLAMCLARKEDRTRLEADAWGHVWPVRG